jgi:pimeloyl-ACP methyl ester carboxylesterase
VLAAAPGRPARASQTEVSFPAADGGVVYADLYGRGPNAVILAPGGRFTKSSWARQARALEASGFRVLAIDFRGRGRSRARPVPQVGDETGDRFDVLGAASYLHQHGAVLISVVGSSLGGGAAAEAAAEAPEQFDRLVLLAHAPIPHPEKLGSVRKLFVVARRDTTASGVPRLVAIREQYERAPDPKELVVLEGTAHAQLLFDTDQGDRLLQAIIRFLSAP